jgi:hypothetical protein
MTRHGLDVQPTTTTTVNVVVTPLLAVTNLRDMDALLFAFHNRGGFPVDVLIETGEFVGVFDSEIVPQFTIAPGEQRSLFIEKNLRSNYRVSGTANGGVTDVEWLVRGLPRARVNL